MDQSTANALANEARKVALKTAIADIQGRIANASSLMGIISSTAQDANRALQAKQAELAALEAGSGPGITENYGERAVFLQAFVHQLHTAGLIPEDRLEEFRALVTPN